MPEESGGKPWPPDQAAVSGPAGARLGPQLFPAGLPMLPRLRLSACHRQAAASTATEADWLDVLVRPGGATVLVIGHAEGPGGQIGAAADRLRTGLREQLRVRPQQPSPKRRIIRMDRVVVADVGTLFRGSRPGNGNEERHEHDDKKQASHSAGGSGTRL